MPRFARSIRLFLLAFLVLVIFTVLQCIDILGVMSTISYLFKVRKDSHVLCPEFTGGLGNLMFQYASALGIARLKNMTVLIDQENDLNHLFNLSAVVLPHVACWFLTKQTDVRANAFDTETLQFPADCNYQLKGYFQSWRYFNHIEPELRQIFQFPEDIRAESQNILNEAIKSHEKQTGNKALTYIGVHIRRGDILESNFQNYGYNVASLDYIRKAMQYFNARYHRILYIVCSNDMGWSKKYLTGTNIYFVEGHEREVDMALLASCNHTVMTVGTFGWWAAWLANGEVTHYRYPAARGSQLQKAFSKDMTDYFYPHWIPML